MKEIIAGKTCHLLLKEGYDTLFYLGVGKASDDLLNKIRRILEIQWPHVNYGIVAYEVANWQNELSPWPCKKVIGKEAFLGGGQETLDWLVRDCLPEVEAKLGVPKRRIIGGYSLAGLFSLWAFYKCQIFQGVMSCSGSLWYPGWQDFVSGRQAPCGSLAYLSLGDQEAHTKNPVLATVAQQTNWQYEKLSQDLGEKSCQLNWHTGGHFKEIDRRLAEGISWFLS